MTVLRSITDFLPPGHQIKSPGGASFDPTTIVGVEASSDDGGSVRIHLPRGVMTITFHRCVDGGPPRVYEVMDMLEEAALTVPERAARRLGVEI